jgi:hypothetical protein
MLFFSILAAVNLILWVKFVCSYCMILDSFSVTRVHMLTPMLSIPLYFTGDSSLPKRKRRLIQNEEGVLVDEVAIRQRLR